MVDVIGRARVIVTGDVDSTSIDQAGGKIGASLKKAALVGGAALGTLAVAGVKAFQAFEVAEAQSRKLSNVLGNMGQSGAVEEVEKLADSLMRLTAVDDEVIKGGQTILATFSAVAESAGQTGGTFERATKASLDMSAVFGSVEGAARVLGKALSDPEKAAALLRRSNVILTEEQKNLITAFVEAGDAAGAQGVILDALEERYAGTAEAAKTQTDSIKTAFGELQESAGNLIAKLGGEGGGGGGLTGAIYGVSDALNETAESEAWGDLGKDLRDTGTKVGDLTGGLFDLDKKIGSTILKIPGFGEALANLVSPTRGVIKVVLQLVDALKKLDRELEGNSGTVIRGGNNTSFGDSDFINQITGNAVGGPASGLTLVGERGAELLELPAGSYVHNNNATKEMLAGAGGDVNLTIINNGPVTGADMLQDMEWSARYGALSASGGFR